MSRRAADKLFDKMPGRDLLMTWAITDEEISTRTDLAGSDLKWAALHKVVRCHDGFLLFPTKQSFYWLPDRAFANPDDLARFAELATAKAKRFGQQKPRR